MESGAPRPDTTDMIAVHQVFRSSLASAPAYLASTRGDDARRALIADYYANLLAFLEVHHEGEEILVFPLLAERAPESSDIVATMASQHAEVHSRLDQAKSSLSGWSQGGDAAIDDAAMA